MTISWDFQVHQTQTGPATQRHTAHTHRHTFWKTVHTNRIKWSTEISQEMKLKGVKHIARETEQIAIFIQQGKQNVQESYAG